MPEDTPQMPSQLELVTELANRIVSPDNVSIVVVIDRTTNQVSISHTARTPMDHLSLMEVLAKSILEPLLRPVAQEIHAAAQLRDMFAPKGMDILRERHRQYLLDKQMAEIAKSQLFVPGTGVLLDQNGQPYRN